MRGLFAVVCALWAAGPAWGQPASAPAGRAPSGVLAAGSLRRSALSMTAAHPDTPGRAGRLVALVRCAEGLAPGHPRTQMLLAGIYESQGKHEEAADAVGRYLAVFGEDHVQHLRRIRLLMAGRQTAAARETLFKELARQQGVPAPVRGEAAALWGNLLVGKGDKAQAAKAYALAVQLDPFRPDALRGALALQESPGPVDRLRTLLKVLEGYPGDTRVAAEAGALLGDLGDYEQAWRFGLHAARLLLTQSTDPAQRHEATIRILDAALDGGDPETAIGMAQPALREFGDSLDLGSLLIEAHRALKQDDKADKLVQRLEAAYKGDQGPDGAAPKLDHRALAWLYLVTLPKPDAALKHATQAVKDAPNDPVCQRALGVAEVRTGAVDQGVTRLGKLVDVDPYAAAALVEHHFANGRKDVAAKILLGAAKRFSRRGPAFRRLRALGAAQGVVLPPSAGAADAGKAAAAFPQAHLDLVLTPGKSVSVTLRPVKERATAGEDIAIQVTLANVGPVGIPLGRRGLFSPVLALRVSTGGVANSRTFADLPLVELPAPRYLAPGTSVTARATLNVGSLGRALATAPLETVRLTVSGVLDPVQEGRGLSSTLPAVHVAPVKLLRVGLIAGPDRPDPSTWRKRYQDALGRIVFSLARGEIPDRIRAARRIGGLLGMARQTELGRASPPSPLWKSSDKAVLMRMMVEALKDKSDVVRAEMLAALEDVALDEAIIGLLAPAIGDPSPLVRFRLAELLGASGAPGQEPVLDFLAEDKDPRVRGMVSAFKIATKP